MYCPNCGSEVRDVKFCPNCGQKVDAVKKVAENESIEMESENEISSTKKPSEMIKVTSPKQFTENVKESKYSVSEFVYSTLQKEGQETFELQNKYLLNVNLYGKIWAKKGAMVAYTGAVKFRREGTLEHGLDKFVKKAVTGESSTLMKVEGQGKVYLADQGKEIVILNLLNEKIYVNGNDLLAFEDGIDWDIKMMTTGTGVMSGGLFNIKLEGTGMIAITTHYTPITLLVTPNKTVYTDPNATVAWSGGIEPSIKTDLDFKTLIGKDSGETFQMKFKGDGFVIVQPFEEY